MKFFLPLLMLVVVLTGCGNEAQYILKIHKSNAVIVENDVFLEHKGTMLTAKNQADKLNNVTGDYLKIIGYKDGSFLITEE